MVVSAILLLPGCFRPDEKVLFSFSGWEASFETVAGQSIIILNVTVTKADKNARGGPWLDITFAPWVRDPQYHRARPPNATGSTGTLGIQFVEETWSMAEPPRPTYYESDALVFLNRTTGEPYWKGTSPVIGPLSFSYNEPRRLRFGFLNFWNFTGDQGYYTFEIHSIGAQPSRVVFYSGCFNLDTAFFYDHHPDGRRCLFEGPGPFKLAEGVNPTLRYDSPGGT